MTRLERDFPRELYAEHGHPGHPEEEDVVASLHQRERVEAAEVISLKRNSKIQIRKLN